MKARSKRLRGALYPILIGIGCFAVQPLHAESPPILVVAPLRSELSADLKVGARRTGALCLPAGSIRWSDVVSDPAMIARKISAALQARELASMTSEEAEDRPGTAVGSRRLIVTVTAADVDACVPQQGLVRMIGGRRRLKANGTVAISMRMSNGSETVPPAAAVVVRIAYEGASPLSQIAADAIAETVAREVARLR